MPALREVHLAPRAADELGTLIGAARLARFRAAGSALAEVLAGRTVWNVSLDESATGVSELVRSVLGYIAGFGIATRWVVLEPDAGLRRLARTVRHRLQGFAADAPVPPEVRATYERFVAPAARELDAALTPGDLVILHDPGPAGLVAAAVAAGAIPIWRCHAASAETAADDAWAFMRPYVEAAAAYVFSRPVALPAWTDASRVEVVAPSIDPLRPKNRALEPAMVVDVLTSARFLAGAPGRVPRYTRIDGTEAPLRAEVRFSDEDGPIAADVPVVAQITRWDPLKDMAGVLTGFARYVRDPDAHLVLAGPDPAAPAADPIAQTVYAECHELRAALPEAQRRRVHLVTLPTDPDDSALIINALQRHARVVAQKTLVADQSTAVSEAMLKARPIVASGIGGITDQIRDHQDGLLVRDPTDLEGFAHAVDSLLHDPGLADTLRYNAYQHAVDTLLPDHHLLAWAAVVSALVTT